jgi:hypothetical protein
LTHTFEYIFDTVAVASKNHLPLVNQIFQLLPNHIHQLFPSILRFHSEKFQVVVSEKFLSNGFNVAKLLLGLSSIWSLVFGFATGELSVKVVLQFVASECINSFVLASLTNGVVCGVKFEV